MMNNPCDECILLAMCNKKIFDQKLTTCSMLRAAIIRESNILDPKGLSQLIMLDDLELYITVKYNTDYSYNTTKKQFLLVYVEHGYHYEIILGNYEKMYDEMKLFYDKPYIGMD